MRPTDTDRGASIAISHALTIGITALLISGLLLSAGSFLQNQEKRVAYQEMRELNSDLNALVHQLDQLNATGERVSVTMEPTYPRTITGEPYTVALIPDAADPTSGTLYVNLSDGRLQSVSAIATDTQLDRAVVSGGEPTVRLCSGPGNGQTITLGGCA